MTTAADDSAVEDLFEAILAGRPAPEGSAGLAAFTEAVRTTATAPGRPSAALAELLATGLLVDQSSPSSRTARSAGTPSSRGSRVRIRRRFAMFPALLAKILSAGAVAQAATGATVVVVAFAGAGAAGVLPGPAQETFTSIVSDESEKLSDGGPGEESVDEAALPVEGSTEEQSTEETSFDPTEVWSDPVEWATTGPVEGQPFSAWVSFGSANGWTDGAVVSCWAHARNDERRAERNGGATDGASADCAPEAEAPVSPPEGGAVEGTSGADVPVESEQTTQERGGRGNAGNGGNGGGGNGNGNGGGGNGNGNGGGSGNGRN